MTKSVKGRMMGSPQQLGSVHLASIIKEVILMVMILTTIIVKIMITIMTAVARIMEICTGRGNQHS